MAQKASALFSKPCWPPQKPLCRLVALKKALRHNLMPEARGLCSPNLGGLERTHFISCERSCDLVVALSPLATVAKDIGAWTDMTLGRPLSFARLPKGA
jgi:hypothetical protein